MDISQDSARNPFTKKMRPVYQACKEDKGTGVTKRSISRIGDVLSNKSSSSPFASLSRGTSRWFESADKRHIRDNLEKSVSCVLDQVYETMDGLLGEKVKDEAELAARADLKQFLPSVKAAWEQIDKDLKAIMARYE